MNSIWVDLDLIQVFSFLKLLLSLVFHHLVIVYCDLEIFYFYVFYPSCFSLLWTHFSESQTSLSPN